MESNNSRPASIQQQLLFRRLENMLTFPSIAQVNYVEHDCWLHCLNCSACGYLVIDEYVLCSKEGHLTCLDCWMNNRDLVCQFNGNPANPNSKLSDVQQGVESSNRQGSSMSKKDGNQITKLGGNGNIDLQNDSNGGVPRNQTLGNKVYKADFLSLSGADADEDGNGSAKEIIRRWDKLLQARCAADKTGQSVCGGTLERRSHPFLEEYLSNMDLYCPYWKDGCTDPLSAKEIRDHVSQCPYNISNRISEIQLSIKGRSSGKNMQEQTVKSEAPFPKPSPKKGKVKQQISNDQRFMNTSKYSYPSQQCVQNKRFSPNPFRIVQNSNADQISTRSMTPTFEKRTYYNPGSPSQVVNSPKSERKKETKKHENSPFRSPKKNQQEPRHWKGSKCFSNSFPKPPQEASSLVKVDEKRPLEFYRNSALEIRKTPSKSKLQVRLNLDNINPSEAMPGPSSGVRYEMTAKRFIPSKNEVEDD